MALNGVWPNESGSPCVTSPLMEFSIVRSSLRITSSPALQWTSTRELCGLSGREQIVLAGYDKGLELILLLFKLGAFDTKCSLLLYN